MLFFQASNWPLAKTQYLPVLAVFIFSLFAFAFEDSLLETFVYYRTFIIDGQYWRILSGHFFHTNINHLLLNLTGLWLLWSLHGEYYHTKLYLGLFTFSALIVSAGLLLFSPNLQQYVGLSGVLHAIFIWGALKDIEHKLKSGYLLLGAVILKIIHEQTFGASEEMVQLINANVAINAHLFGAIAGGVFFILTSMMKKDGFKKG